MFSRRSIICSFEAYEKVKAALPNRHIETTSWAPNGWFYWFGHKGAVRMMRYDDPTVWICDYGRGFPYIKVRRILKL